MNEYLPLSFWSFNGDMDKKRIEEQVYQLYEQRFSGFFIHARAGLRLDYMSTEWFAACATAIATAEKLGMNVWLYDEDGWPSGFGGGEVCALGEDYQAKQLEFSTADTSKERLLGVYRKKGNAYFRIDPAHAKKGDLFCHYVVVPHYVDLLNPAVTQVFIRSTHEKYAFHFGDKFGTVIKGIFTDEPQMVCRSPYSRFIFEEYKKRYKEDLLDDLWLLYINGEGYEKYRVRYWQIVGELFANHFTKPIAEWCEKHHLDMTGHFGNEDGLCEQVRGNGDLMTHYSFMQRPGIDYLGRRLTTPVLMKQVADAADIGEKPMIMSESFGCSGWDVSFRELCWIAGWESAFGINNVVTHLSAYSIEGCRKRDYPAFYSDQEPWWDRFRLVSERIAFINEIISRGESQRDILLLQPLNGMWCESAVEIDPLPPARDISNQYRLTVEYLLDLQVNFTIVNDQLLNQFDCANGCFTLRDRRYHTVIVPQTKSIHKRTMERLADFAAAGGKVIFVNRLPELVNGVHDPSLSKQLGKLPYTVLCNRRGLWEKYFLRTGYHRTVEVLDGNGEHTATGLVTNVRRVKDGYYIYLFHPATDENKKVWLQIDTPCKAELLCEPHVTRSLPMNMTHDGKSVCPLELEPMEGMLIRVYDAENNLPAVIRPPLLSTVRYLRDWQVKTDDVNALTVDRCDIFIDQKKVFSNVCPVGKMDDLYQQLFLAQKETAITATYRFYNDMSAVDGSVLLAAETRHMESIFVNGVDVTKRVNGWWMDSSILTYSIEDLLTDGMNRVDISFRMDQMRSLYSCQGKFETEANRFSYDVELESIYILGRFDVRSTAKPMHSKRMHIVPAQTPNTFSLCDATEKQYGDLTEQGLWFYRGNATFDTTVSYRSGQQAILSVGRLDAALADVKVNGHLVSHLYRAPLRVDLSEFLQDGENDLQIVLYGTNRNLLGPHHHQKGNLHFVGPSGFAGVRGWEDFLNPDVTDEQTWVDSFSFIPFGIQDVSIQYYE